jgi:neutral ceramidase
MRRGTRTARLIAGSALIATALLWAPPANAAGLQAGAGRADITPPTGYYLMGWVRSDAQAQGQFTRLFARAIVLRQGKRKVALVAADLGFVPAGLVADVAERLRRRGFTEGNVVISASHTHSAPAGYSNYPAFNTVAPTTTTPSEFELGSPADEQLYTFLVKRLAKAIARADRDRDPARAGWGRTQLHGVTENRSVEAHLANHDVSREFGGGSAELDPLGARHTIDPEVSVLRVDKLIGGRRVPIGIWSTFANHGTVVKPDFPYYNADHHAAAARLAEARIRRRGDVPRGQTVVNAYGNSDEGDMTAGLRWSGPAGATQVGRREARAFVRAWRSAGRDMRARLGLRTRWTVACFCGRDTAAGPVDDHAVVGLPFITGSEENRGPLYDETGVPFEGNRLPAGVGPQGVKIQAVAETGSGTFPGAVPLTTVRVADRAIVTVPGEMTAGMGKRLKDSARQAVRGSGIRRIVVSGLANDFIQYFTTPEEYDRQHYEGGSTLFGRATSVFIQERLIELLVAMVAGDPAPPPDPHDARNGVSDDAPRFPRGAAKGRIVGQPVATERMSRATLRWRGGPLGYDRPLDRAFVRIQRRGDDGWRTIDSDLGLQMLWEVDNAGTYAAHWEPTFKQRTGRHRFVITANRYRLRSRAFAVKPARRLRVSGGELRYPAVVENRDLAWRPAGAAIVGRGARPTDRYGNAAGR